MDDWMFDASASISSGSGRVDGRLCADEDLSESGPVVVGFGRIRL